MSELEEPLGYNNGFVPPSYRCPFCGDSMVLEYYDVIWGYGTCEEVYHCPVDHEEVYHCPVDHISYEFAYGSNRMTIGREEWIWSGEETPDEYRKRMTEMDIAIRKLQRIVSP